MKPSAIARKNYQEMIARAKRMTPEERLMAYLSHNQLIAQLHQAGARYRTEHAARRKRRVRKKS